MSESTYGELIARLRAGDRDAQTEVFERYAHEIIRRANNNLRRRPATAVGADAVAQSVLLSFFARHTADEIDLRDPNSLWLLLLAITLRHCEKWNKHFRAAKRKEPVGAIGVRAADRADDQEGPDMAVQFNDSLECFLGRLTPMQQRIVELRLQGRTIKQITEQVGRSQATVSHHLRKIRALLEEDSTRD